MNYFDEVFGSLQNGDDNNGLSSDKNYYQLLGCAPSSTKEQIAAEYKIRARQKHPDKKITSLLETAHQNSEDHVTNLQETVSGHEDGRGEFQELVKAYEILSDDEMRAKYDHYLASGLRISFKKFLEFKDRGHSFHWRENREPANRIMDASSSKNNENIVSSNQSQKIENSPQNNKNRITPVNNSASQKQLTSEELIKMFRNYKV